jgi:hypothetical protein
LGIGANSFFENKGYNLSVGIDYKELKGKYKYYKDFADSSNAIKGPRAKQKLNYIKNTIAASTIFGVFTDAISGSVSLALDRI